MAPAIPWPINTTYTQSGPMPDVMPPSRSNPIPSPTPLAPAPSSASGRSWSGGPSSSSPDSGSPSPIPACSAVRVQGSRRPLGSPCAVRQYPLGQVRGCAPTARTANAGCHVPVALTPVTPSWLARLRPRPQRQSPPRAVRQCPLAACVGARLRLDGPNGECRVPVALALTPVTPSWLARLHPSGSPQSPPRHRHRPPVGNGLRL
jgi:hypothetical protein